MKNLFTFLITFFTIAANAQIPALQKLWVGDNKLYVTADTGNTIRFESLATHVLAMKGRESITYINNDQAAHYKLMKDTMRLRDWYFSGLAGELLIDTLAKDKLTLTPVDAIARSFMEYLTGLKQDKYLFKEIHKAATDTIKFEKLIYKIKGGYPSVRTTVYELSSDGKFKMFREKSRYVTAIANVDNMLGVKNPPDPGANDEYLTAMVPNALMKQLTDILKISEIDKLPEKGQQNIDITEQTIEIYYNHKVKYMTAGWMPFVAQPLAGFLRTLPQKLALIPAAGKFDIVMLNDKP